MKKLIRILFSISCILSLSSVSFAQLLNNAFQDAAVAEFKKDDFQLLEKALKELHQNGTVNAISSWSNSNTGNSGSVKIESLTKWKEMPCQKIEMKNVAKSGTKGSSVHIFCNVGNDTWKIKE